VLVIAAVEMWFYDFIPTVFFVIMIAAALACRAAVAGDYATAPAAERAHPVPAPAGATL
jgi:hypothetical protein